jgi:branched-chain amino acid transport system substrate-binding protein
MGRARHLPSRLATSLAVLGLAATACSIQGPNVTLSGSGGSDQALGTLEGTQANPAGTQVGGVKIGGGSLGGTSPVEVEKCLGKSTDVGVSGNKIRLGSTFAISGPVSNISGPILKGVKAYFNEVNANGGLFGRKIELVFYDDGWDAQRGKAKIKQLVEQDRVLLLTTVPSSNGLDAAATYLEQKRVPVFGTSGLIESQFRSAMQWPIGTSTRSAARIGLLDNANRLGAKTIGLIWLDLLAGFEARDSLLKALSSGFVKGVKLVADRRVSLSEPSFESVWNDVQNQAKRNGVADGRPDFVALAIDPTNAIKALQAAQRLGFRPKIGWGGGAPLFLDLTLSGSEYAAQTGLYAGTSYFPPLAEFQNIPAVREYQRVVRKYFGNVDVNNPYLEGGFAGAALTVEVLRRLGPCVTRADAIKAANGLTGFSAAGLTQPLTYRALGVGPQHYGNTWGMVVRAVPKGTQGCTREIGCWVWIKAPTSNGWYRDPRPGA